MWCWWLGLRGKGDLPARGGGQNAGSLSLSYQRCLKVRVVQFEEVQFIIRANIYWLLSLKQFPYLNLGQEREKSYLLRRLFQQFLKQKQRSLAGGQRRRAGCSRQKSRPRCSRGSVRWPPAGQPGPQSLGSREGGGRGWDRAGGTPIPLAFTCPRSAQHQGFTFHLPSQAKPQGAGKQTPTECEQMDFKFI